MGDRLWATRPPRRRTSLPFTGRRCEYPEKAGGANRHDTLARIRGLAVWAGVWLTD